MDRIEPKIGELGRVESGELPSTSFYASPNSDVRPAVQKNEISTWKPLFFLMLVFVLSGPTISDSAKQFISLSVGSIPNALITILIWVGMIWWSVNDSKKYGYKITKTKIVLTIIFGPLGIALYSFSTRGLTGGILLLFKMAIYILVLIMLAGFSSEIFDKSILPILL